MSASTGVVYAQTFIDNPEDREVIMAFGGEGSFRIWIADQEILTVEEEIRTELDNYQKKVFLPKGKHRVLVQLGFTSESSYPNFLLRFLDLNGKPVTDLNNSSSTEYVDYVKSGVNVIEDLPHFAIEHFKNEIEKDEDNIVNHILLAKCYRRAKQNNKAVSTLKEALKFYPNNIIANYELLRNLQNLDDRTELLKQVEKMRDIDEDLLFITYYDYGQAKSKDDLDEMSELIDKLEKDLGANDPTVIEYKIELASKKQDYVTLTDLVDLGYSKHPNNTMFLQYKYVVGKQLNENSPPIKLLENYLKKNYNYEVTSLLMEEYREQGKGAKADKMTLKLHQNFPDEIGYIEDMMYAAYEKQNFPLAKKFSDQIIDQAPYRSSAHMSRAYINMALNRKEDAITDLKRTIELNPNSFDARERLRELEEKESLVTLMKSKGTDELIDEKLDEEDNSDFSYKYIFYDESHIHFTEGAALEYTNIGIKILNESGIDSWKEASIPVNYTWENLTILNAVVHTTGGQKIEAERNYNQLVFPSIGVGDILHIEYRKDIFTGGKLADEFFLDYTFSSSVPVEHTSYKLLTPEDFKYHESHSNLNTEAKEYKVDEFVCKEWVLEDVPAIKSEYYMPPYNEIGKTINLSTVESWSEISEWYQDIALPMAKEDYSLLDAYDDIFKGKTYASDLEKHKAIYDYICDNIKYSSVSFRQSNFVPQKPLVTLNTKLGDCKDMSLLYYTLANKAGLKSNLVLVNTRDNGENGLVLPSTSFNHCIV